MASSTAPAIIILSTMEDTGRDFADVLAEAQARGYAEADPALRHRRHRRRAQAVDPRRASPSAPAIDFASVETAGIARLLAADIAQADALGYRHPADRHGRGRPVRTQRAPVPAGPAASRAVRPSARPCRWRDQCGGRRGQFFGPAAVPGRGRGRRADRERSGRRPDRHCARRYRRAVLGPGRRARGHAAGRHRPPPGPRLYPLHASPTAPACSPRSPRRCAMPGFRSKA